MDKSQNIENIMGIVDEGTPYLEFKLELENYLVDIKYVKELVRYDKLTNLPSSPFYVKGLLKLRGEVVQVIDLRDFFGLKSLDYNRFTVIIILELNSKKLGIITDEVTGVFSTNAKILKIEEDINLKKYLKGVIKDEDKYYILDILKLY